MSKDSNREIEEVVDKLEEIIFMRGAKMFPSTRIEVANEIHHQLQKARVDWLREEIVRLQNAQNNLRESCRGSYKIIVLTKETESAIDTLQTIIDRYHSELGQDDGMPHPFGNPEGVYDRADKGIIKD